MPLVKEAFDRRMTRCFSLNRLPFVTSSMVIIFLSATSHSNPEYFNASAVSSGTSPCASRNIISYDRTVPAEFEWSSYADLLVLSRYSSGSRLLSNRCLGAMLHVVSQGSINGSRGPRRRSIQSKTEQDLNINARSGPSTARESLDALNGLE